MHETIHLVFLDHFQQSLVARGLSRDHILNINEAFPVLINLLCADLCLAPADNNKPTAKPYEDIVRAGFAKRTPFPEVLEELAALV